LRTGIDILENELIDQFPEAFKILLRDHTTQLNIIWATDNYSHLGEEYKFKCQILPELITEEKGFVIMPRVHKDKILQQARSKEMAEVFTPSWICNSQNNLIDNAWFGRKDVFNKEIPLENGTCSWETNPEKIEFSKGKTWKDYIRNTRLEMACGEAPYLTSRYDSTTGEPIQLDRRVGLIDRKLRVINENVDKSGLWLKAAQVAYKKTYGFEWQGDSLLLAREAMLATFIENYTYKFGKEPPVKSIEYIAYIISWNIWQMDGLKGVIPQSCGPTIKTIHNLFETITETNLYCEGCLDNKIRSHTGTYCLIKNWTGKDPKTGKTGIKIRFIDLLKGKN
jgi:hypothetical protein